MGCLKRETHLTSIVIVAVDVRLGYTLHSARDYDVVFLLVSPRNKTNTFRTTVILFDIFSTHGARQLVVRELLCVCLRGGGGASCRDAVGAANRKFAARIEKQLYIYI